MAPKRSTDTLRTRRRQPAPRAPQAEPKLREHNFATIEEFDREHMGVAAKE